MFIESLYIGIVINKGAKMTFKQACDIIYPAVAKYCYVKSGIKVETKFEVDGVGNPFFVFGVTIEEQGYFSVSSYSDNCDFEQMAEWIESKC